MIKKLQDTINSKRKDVEKWFSKQYASISKKKLPLPIYSSFDLRDSGSKAAIVDSNLFPAGFNNISGAAKDKAVAGFKKYIKANLKGKAVLIVPEAHTRNLYYLSNLCSLKRLLTSAGFTVVIGHMQEEEVLELKDSKGHTVILEKIKRKGNSVYTKSFNKGFILLNNDFSVGNPPLLDGLGQTIIPPLFLGWAHRKKSTHCRFFDTLLEDFTSTLKIDAWLLQAYCDVVNNVDFRKKGTLEDVAAAVDRMLSKIQLKYDEYGIESSPYVFVKDNSGTYGMGILSVHSGSEILNLNSDKRRKMVFGKDKSQINSVMIQEGVETSHTVEGGAAEPVLYSVGGKVIGGFMRINPKQSSKVNLNAPGAKFDALLETKITKPLLECITDKSELSLYGILGDIANLAIACEYGGCKG